MEKPIQLRIEEAKQEIVSSINEIIKRNEIDYYFLHSILKDIFIEVEGKKDNQLYELRNLYEEEQKKQQEEATNSNGEINQNIGD